MRRRLSLFLSVLMFMGAILSGGPGMTAWADQTPTKPTGLNAILKSSTEITVSWNDVGNNDGYELYLGESTLLIDQKSATYSHKGLEANTTYSYKVRSYKNIAEINEETEEPTGNTIKVYSDFTDPVSVNTPPAPVVPPTAPTSLTSTALDTNSIRLNWSSGTGTIDGYYIERKLAGGSWDRVQTITNSGAVSFTNTGLAANTTYYYRIQAYNSGGASPYSNETNAATPQIVVTKPAKPTNLIISQVGTDRVTLTWKDDSNNETGFKIERKTGNGNYSEIATVGANATTYTNTGLSNSTTYTYRVRAYNTAGSSDASNEATVTTTSIPGKPDNLKISATGTDRLTITWRDNANNEKGFRIERKPVNGTFSEIATVSANVTTYTNTGLSNNTTYIYRVRAYNDAGNSQYSNETTGKTGVSLAKPDTLEVSSISTDRVTITWKDRSNNETGFVIERKTENGSFSEIATVRANTTSYTDTRLRNNTTYTYRIQAYNNEGRSEFSEELKVTTGLVPDKPTELTITLVDTDRIRIEWKDNADNETGFRIERKTENGDFTEIATVRSNVTSYTNTGLRNRTEYTYRVRAYNNTGNSAFSNEVKTVTGLVPEAPDRLTITSEEKDRVTLTWRDRSDNEKGFIVERRTGSGSYTKVATLSANTTTYTDRSLTSGQSYTYRVKSYNDVGESDSSNEVTAKTTHEIITKLTIGSTQYRVDGQLRTMDAAPIIYESRTLLPIRYVAEAIGATVLWDASDERVTVMLDDTVVELWIGSNIARVNGVRTQIDANNSQVKPLIIPPGRTMMPLAFISRSLGCDVQWNDATREVTVTYLSQ